MAGAVEEFNGNGHGYWHRVAQRAKELHTDHCSGAPDLPWTVLCCDEHDVHYRSHRTLAGKPISKLRADWRLSRCIQKKSPLAAVWLGALSPSAWLFFLGVTVGGRAAWNKRLALVRRLPRKRLKRKATR